MWTAVLRLYGELVKAQLRTDLVNIEEVQRRRCTAGGVGLLDSQQPAQLRVADPSQTSQRTTSTVGCESPRDGDDLGGHSIGRAHREKLGRSRHPGRPQRTFQPCVTHYDRTAPTPTFLHERIRGI